MSKSSSNHILHHDGNSITKAGALHRIISAQDDYIRELEDRLSTEAPHTGQHNFLQPLSPAEQSSSRVVDSHADRLRRDVEKLTARNQSLVAEVEKLRVLIAKQDIKIAQLAHSEATVTTAPVSDRLTTAATQDSLNHLRALTTEKDLVLARERQLHRVALEQQERESQQFKQLIAEEANQLKIQLAALRNSLADEQDRHCKLREEWDAQLRIKLKEQAEQLQNNYERELFTLKKQLKTQIDKEAAVDTIVSAEWNNHISETSHLIKSWEQRESTLMEQVEVLQHTMLRYKEDSFTREMLLLNQIDDHRQRNLELQNMLEERERMAAETVRVLRQEIDSILRSNVATDNHLKSVLESRLEQEAHFQTLRDLQEAIKSRKPSSGLHRQFDDCMATLGDIQNRIDQLQQTITEGGGKQYVVHESFQAAMHSDSREVDLLKEQVAALITERLALQNENSALRSARGRRNSKLARTTEEALRSQVQVLEAQCESNAVAFATREYKYQSQLGALSELIRTTQAKNLEEKRLLTQRLDALSIENQESRVHELLDVLEAERRRFHEEINITVKKIQEPTSTLALVESQYQNEIRHVRQAVVTLQQSVKCDKAYANREIERLRTVIEEIQKARSEEGTLFLDDFKNQREVMKCGRESVLLEELNVLTRASELVELRAKATEERLRSTILKLHETLHNLSPGASRELVIPGDEVGQMQSDKARDFRSDVLTIYQAAELESSVKAREEQNRLVDLENSQVHTRALQHSSVAKSMKIK